MSKAAEVFKQVHELDVIGKMKVAIGLIERGQPDRAEMILEVALQQLQGERLLGKDVYRAAVQVEVERLTR